MGGMDHPHTNPLLVFFFLMACCSSWDQNTDEAEETRIPIIDAARSLFSFPTASHWDFRLPNSFNQRWPCFPSCPNLDFRGGGGPMGGEQLPKDQVKLAVVNTLDKSKSTVQDSEKSAAQAVDNTVRKLKKTIYGKLVKDQLQPPPSAAAAEL